MTMKPFIQGGDYSPSFLRHLWFNKKKRLLEDIPSTSPAMSDRERDVLQTMIFHSKKRPLLKKWPHSSSIPE